MRRRAPLWLLIWILWVFASVLFGGESSCVKRCFCEVIRVFSWSRLFSFDWFSNFPRRPCSTESAFLCNRNTSQKPRFTKVTVLQYTGTAVTERKIRPRLSPVGSFYSPAATSRCPPPHFPLPACGGQFFRSFADQSSGLGVVGPGCCSRSFADQPRQKQAKKSKTGEKIAI